MVYLLQLPDGAPVVLRNTAALIWLLAAEGEGAVAGVAEAVDRAEEDLAGSVLSFLGDFRSRGFLEEDPAG